MKYLFYLFLLLSCFDSKAQGALALSGTVNDDKGETIPGATVFISNTKYATSTDNKGRFYFADIQAGDYEVVSRMMGFTPLAERVTVKEKPVSIIISLKQSNTTLKTVTITDFDPNRERFMKLFIKNFIGETFNGMQCKILNPGVIKFVYNKNTDVLEVNATDLLVIENNALGYRIKYLVNKFEYHITQGICVNNGYPYFEEMKGDDGDQRRWKINRKAAYMGSRWHFYRAMNDGTASKVGFSACYIVDKKTLKLAQSFQPITITSEISLNTGPQFNLTVDTVNLGYLMYFNGRQVALFSKNPEKSFTLTGRWARQKLGDLVPADAINNL